MKCGLCGSGITADEKYKKLKNGSVNSHIYYGCTKVRDRNCKCGYINETDLIKQLQGLVDILIFKENMVIRKLKDDVGRYKRFHYSLLSKNIDIPVSDTDVKKYIKFVLKYGHTQERRSLIENLESKLLLKDKKVYILD